VQLVGVLRVLLKRRASSAGALRVRLDVASHIYGGDHTGEAGNVDDLISEVCGVCPARWLCCSSHALCFDISRKGLIARVNAGIGATGYLYLCTAGVLSSTGRRSGSAEPRS
jgi:hypothetical protein